MKLILHADGASRGNPGQAAIGATIKDGEGQLLASISQQIGRATNNQAEYRAVIAALKEAVNLGAGEVDVYLDSELVVKQVNGSYRVRNAALKPLYLEMKELAASFKGFSISHIPRRQNAEADDLANAAFKQ